jgi:hypothetical protein
MNGPLSPIEASFVTEPSINTDQGQISGGKVSTGNKTYIAEKGPVVNTEQDKSSGSYGPMGNKGYILFPVEPLSPEIVPCSALMGGPLVPI